jgi:hypothetical protein
MSLKTLNLKTLIVSKENELQSVDMGLDPI